MESGSMTLPISKEEGNFKGKDGEAFDLEGERAVEVET